MMSGCPRLVANPDNALSSEGSTVPLAIGAAYAAQWPQAWLEPASTAASSRAGPASGGVSTIASVPADDLPPAPLELEAPAPPLAAPAPPFDGATPAPARAVEVGVPPAPDVARPPEPLAPRPPEPLAGVPLSPMGLGRAPESAVDDASLLLQAARSAATTMLARTT
jgi:hypothetical protein